MDLESPNKYVKYVIYCKLRPRRAVPSSPSACPGSLIVSVRLYFVSPNSVRICNQRRAFWGFRGPRTATFVAYSGFAQRGRELSRIQALILCTAYLGLETACDGGTCVQKLPTFR